MKNRSDASIRKRFQEQIVSSNPLNFPSEASAGQQGLGQERQRESFEKLLETDSDLYIVYHASNVAATWFSVLSIVVMNDLNEAEDEVEALDEQIAALAFFSRLANDLWAILELVERGFDLQARALTRAYLEHVDVLICCIQDKALTSEFVRATGAREANEFWHKHVSKNRAKTKVTNFVARALGLETATIVDTLREDAELAGAALIHPSIVGGLATALGDVDADYHSYPIFPQPLAASAGTLRTILVHLLWLSFATGALPQGWGGEWQPIIRSQRRRGDPDLVRFQLLYSRMLGFLLDNKILMEPVSKRSPRPTS